MGAWAIASVLLAYFFLTEGKSLADPVTNFKTQHVPVRLARNSHGVDGTKGLLINDVHSAVPIESAPEASNYQPYDVQVYKFSEEDARTPNQYIYSYNNEVGSYETGVNYNDFASIENDAQAYNQNLDTAGYEHYKTSTSFTLEGPKQLETITTHSYHKESEPFDVSGFQKPRKDEEEDERAEVHYHQHKHLHKHNHKQEHLHKHEQEHKHEHGHDHNHYGQHEHKHDAQHKHAHNANHRHVHKAQHNHNHRQEHKHSHQASHKHDHKHKQEHKHDHKHGHKHSHLGEHKHSHQAEHKHNHHHGHKHESKHQHKHDHKAQHKHRHGHKNEHKHQHRDSHYHKYFSYKH